MNEYRKQRCIEIAKGLQHLRSGKSLHFTFVLKKNQLLTFAANDYSKQHLAHKFGIYKPTREYTKGTYIPGRHSEIQALRMYLNKFGNIDMTGLTMFNIRLSVNGETMNSKPCANCARILDSNNFKEIIWT